jgi:hypothetical protein
MWPWPGTLCRSGVRYLGDRPRHNVVGILQLACVPDIVGRLVGGALSVPLLPKLRAASCRDDLDPRMSVMRCILRNRVAVLDVHDLFTFGERERCWGERIRTSNLGLSAVAPRVGGRA